MKKFLVYYFFFLFSLLSIFVSGVLDSVDSLQYLAVARNIYYKGKPSAPSNEYASKKNLYMNVNIGKDGDTYSTTGLGFSLAFLPAVALTDMVYKIYSITPVERFPLENDWLVLLAASFTNAFFGSLLGVVLYSYLRRINLDHTKSLLFSLVGIFTTNLFVYTKHLFAHMMFIVFLVLSFLLIKIFSESAKNKYLILSGISFGIMAVTYNISFMLSVIPLVIYYLMLTKPRINLSSLPLVSKHAFWFILGILPFITIFFRFENLRAAPFQIKAPRSEIAGKVTIITDNINTKIKIYDSSKPNNEKEYMVPKASNVLVKEGQLVPVGQKLTSEHMDIKETIVQQFKAPIPIIFEGIFGQLFSPGRSIFIYSPILLMIIFFWHKIKKDILPEFVVFFVTLILYISFYALQFAYDASRGYTPFWHGESSWGPRYLLPVLPFGVIIVSYIVSNLFKKVIYFVFLPLLLIGLYVQVLGIVMPYQIKYHDLEEEFYVNNQQFTSYIYGDLIPRYTPILAMSKNIVKLKRNFPKSFDHGIYNVKYYDGIDFPFNVGPERWRVIEGNGYISFDDNTKNPITELAFGLINHPLKEASHSATIQFVLNNIPLLDKPIKLIVTQREVVKIPIREGLVQKTNNQLLVNVEYDNPTVISKKEQILGLQSFDINGQRQNMESIDVPYVSALGPKMGATYQNWGGTNKDPWKTWDIHTQMFERLPDFWWIRNLFYWDIPKGWILIPFSLNILVLLFFSVKLFSTIKNKWKY